ncbi:SDR family NAD(P)-dependent oxidoreductase [Pendulispora rubella]|uniref:SDR family NAD(P)-dependent oxidoreductase n=1 Tax=Pendulispora rubella TaxID=2741070 RepID=A0ABZ2L968_9BACT
MSKIDRNLSGRRVLITGAARGIGAALAKRLHARGARVSLMGLEPERLAAVAEQCGGAPYRYCNVTDPRQVEEVIDAAARELGGLDVVVANAGVAAQMAMLGGDVEVMRRTIDVNVMGAFYTLRAAGPHVAHARGYALAVASAAAAIHLPLMGAYSASKVAVEALANTLRIEMKHTGAKVGVAYLSEIDTEMTSIGFGTQAAKRLTHDAGLGALFSVAPLETAISAFERGIAERQRHIYAPSKVGFIVQFRMLAQAFVDRWPLPRLADALEIARAENARLTTPQPGAGSAE